MFNILTIFSTDPLEYSKSPGFKFKWDLATSQSKDSITKVANASIVIEFPVRTFICSHRTSLLTTRYDLYIALTTSSTYIKDYNNREYEETLLRRGIGTTLGTLLTFNHKYAPPFISLVKEVWGQARWGREQLWVWA